MARTEKLLITRVQNLYKKGFDLSYDKIGGSRFPYAVTNWAQSHVYSKERMKLHEIHIFFDGIETTLSHLTSSHTPKARPFNPNFHLEQSPTI